MAIESRDILKTYFETGNIPTEQDFANLIDSYIHRTDDGVYIFEVPGEGKRFGIGIEQPLFPLGIKAQGANDALISLHDQSLAPKWLIDLFPAGAVDKGFNLAQQTSGGSESRLFINEATGHVGLGTFTPEEKLHLEKSTPTGITGLKMLNTATVGNQGWSVGHLEDSMPERNGALSFKEGLIGGDAERIVIAPGGNVGINESLPDTKLHVSRPVSDPGAVISLVEGTGIAVIGPITDNVAIDFQSIQARHGEFIGSVLDIQTATLNLQPLGGDILVHGDPTIADAEKLVITDDAFVGVGVIVPTEKVDVNGAIRIGANTNENTGTIRWTGVDFEGRKDFGWVSLTAGNGPWATGTGNTIFYAPGNAPRVGIGTDVPPSTLAVADLEFVTQGNNAVMVLNASTTTSTGQDDNRVGLFLRCNGTWGGDPLSKNIGIYVPEVVGQAAAEVNLAAVLNGNVVVGDLVAGGNVIGENGFRVLAIQTGERPLTVPTLDTVQVYSLNNSGGEGEFNVMNGNGDVITLYKESALPAAVNTAFPGAYDGTVVDILNNMRTRINQLEQKLQSIGLLA